MFPVNSINRSMSCRLRATAPSASPLSIGHGDEIIFVQSCGLWELDAQNRHMG